eukprot:scaffold131612_cov36-Tisochrysis_lutea.AAC.1
MSCPGVYRGSVCLSFTVLCLSVVCSSCLCFVLPVILSPAEEQHSFSFEYAAAQCLACSTGLRSVSCAKERERRKSRSILSEMSEDFVSLTPMFSSCAVGVDMDYLAYLREIGLESTNEYNHSPATLPLLKLLGSARSLKMSRCKSPRQAATLLCKGPRSKGAHSVLDRLKRAWVSAICSAAMQTSEPAPVQIRSIKGASLDGVWIGLQGVTASSK